MLKDQVFISYRHKDGKFGAELETHLKPYLRKGNFSSWSDQQILRGSRRRPDAAPSAGEGRGSWQVLALTRFAQQA
ncbi:MAG TPA: hypothetical protein VKC60_01085 [Opitutaceae bacterium]|nr:hypothetical protein [Opitutaceae bacterium]